MTRASGCAALLLVAACARETLVVEDLRAPVADRASDPALAIEPGSGDVLLSWVEGDAADSTQWHVAFARSSDGGATWGTPVRVTRDGHDVHPHGEASPRLVAAGAGRVALAWIRSVPVTGRRWPASEVRFARSTDGGSTWSAAVTLNDDTAGAAAGHTFHGAAWRGDSGIVVAWLDERGGAAPGDTPGSDHSGHHVDSASRPAAEPTSDEPDATMYVAESENWGRSWSANRPVWGAVCPCCRVSLVRRPDGSLLSAWRRHFPGSVRDVVTAPLAEPPSRRAAEPLRVHEDGWVYPGCPHTGPGVASDAAGRSYVTWYRGNPGAAGVFYAVSDSAGRFAAPVPVVGGRTLPTSHPRLTALAQGGALVVSDVTAEGRAGLVVARMDARGRVAARGEASQSAGADHPEVISLPDGSALVAWTERANGTARLRLARVQGPR